ncbi:MAG: nucleotidyltransferase domain-containing protein [Lachnospiraceae bacterium]|nr:nucleotidyltransferase domain-containing protein [Lachnospiraceae bacterium]
MFRVDEYLNKLIISMKDVFGDRLLYVGLQGSYLREEATENSDIDIMVIIDSLSVQDLDSYREIITQMEHYEKSCGFICGMDEFSKWNPLELCHILYSTKDYYGKLSLLIPEYREADIINYIKISLGNMYHEMCHRYLHADRIKNYQQLPMTYKNVFFILQNIYYLRTGVFCLTKKELLCKLDETDKEIMTMSSEINSNEIYDFEQAFEKLFLWCQKTLTKLQ